MTSLDSAVIEGNLRFYKWYVKCFLGILILWLCVTEDELIWLEI